MRKTLLYIGILAVLGFSVWFFLFYDRDNVFGAKEAGFTIRDTGAIGKIFIADNNGHSVTLTRDTAGWKANEYRALDAQVQQLLKTLYQQVPQHPVPTLSHDDVIKSLAGNGIKVEVYDRGGSPMRVFYVGTEVQNFGGTYMLLEGAEKPFAVGIPGYDGYLTPRYSPDILTWRERTLFNIQGKDITLASVQYVQEPLNSFTITRNKDSQLNVTIHPQLMEGKTVNRHRAEVFLGFFTRLNAVGVANGLPGLDTVLRDMPKVATIEVGGRNGYHQLADIHFFPMNKRSKNLDAPGDDLASNYDADYFYAVLNNHKDTMIIEQRILKKLFRPGYQFYAPDDTTVKDLPLP